MQEDCDFVGLAQTGTGKTAAFGLPLINNIDTKARLPQGLIICPTRELCLQITKDLETYSKFLENIRNYLKNHRLTFYLVLSLPRYVSIS